MEDIIASFQNAFVKNRLIPHNIIPAAKILHHIKLQKNKKNFWVAFKVDLNKAFHKVSWAFLEEVMKQMNFSPHYIRIVMECITTISLRVLINGDQLESYDPESGLMQGDSLSLYLFILCMNFLSCYLKKGNDNNSIQGMQVGKSGPHINHFIYADDLLLFFKSELSSCHSRTFHQNQPQQIINHIHP